MQRRQRWSSTVPSTRGKLIQPLGVYARQIKALCQDVFQESFWYPRHETFITSAKSIEKFHDCTQVKHEVNALFQSHWDPQGR